MGRLSIKLSLIGITSAIALLFLAFAFFSVLGLDRLNGSTVELADVALPSVDSAGALQADVLGIRLGYATHILLSSVDGMEKQEAQIKQLTADTAADIDAYRKLQPSDAQAARLQDIEKALADYTKQAQAVLKFSKSNQKEVAKTFFNSKLETISQAMLKTISDLRAENHQSVDVTVNASRSVFSQLLSVSLVAIGFVCVALIGAIVFIVRRVATPITNITACMKRLAGGDTDSPIAYAGRKDEVGAMAEAVEVFRQSALANKHLEAEAEQARLHAEAERTKLQKDADTRAQQSLAQATAGFAQGLRKLAAGDLAFQIDQPFAADFEPLRHDLNSAIGQLHAVLSKVAEATSTIDSNAREVSESADDLSKRTEQQAASLEQTAAALDEVTTNVVNSLQTVEQARSIAGQAKDSAAESGKIVSDAVDAMQKIERSSSKIGNIIGVIDEIAFQTNLLALNAGIEAARAGDAGKGFAVVAQEVRELAQRSATAAKEIKALVAVSEHEVLGGVKLVEGAGAALQAIESYIVQINDLMNNIASAAKEQSIGLGEVNTAVNQMDQVTQQNAAMVEETSAAGATLADQSIRLQELIGQFVLSPRQNGAVRDESYRYEAA